MLGVTARHTEPPAERLGGVLEVTRGGVYSDKRWNQRRSPATWQTPDDTADSPMRLDPPQPIPPAKAAVFSGPPFPHLPLLYGRGARWGMTMGDTWLTAGEAVKAYPCKNRRPRPQSRRRTDQPERGFK